MKSPDEIKLEFYVEQLETSTRMYKLEDSDLKKQLDDIPDKSVFFDKISKLYKERYKLFMKFLKKKNKLAHKINLLNRFVQNNK